jgi:hypothetical protein
MTSMLIFAAGAASSVDSGGSICSAGKPTGRRRERPE